MRKKKVRNFNDLFLFYPDCTDFNPLLAIKVFWGANCIHDVQLSNLCEFTYELGDFNIKQVF